MVQGRDPHSSRTQSLAPAAAAPFSPLLPALPAPRSFNGVDIALFSAGGSISKKFAPIASEAGCTVVDNSSAFRMTVRSARRRWRARSWRRFRRRRCALPFLPK